MYIPAVWGSVGLVGNFSFGQVIEKAWSRAAYKGRHDKNINTHRKGDGVFNTGNSIVCRPLFPTSLPFNVTPRHPGKGLRTVFP